MKEKIKVFSILILAGFSFFYTSKVSNIIKENDPIMKEILEKKEDVVVSKIDPIVINDEYYSGINGCIVDEETSYSKMKNEGSFNIDLLVMKEDKVKENNNKYIIGGNKSKRNVSIILTNYNEKMYSFLKDNNIKINYFLDGNDIEKNIDILIEMSKNSHIYNYGRDNNYSSKYLLYDNSLIINNFNNDSTYCLLTEKKDDILKLCTKYNMKVIKTNEISDSILNNVRENLSNGKIFLFNNIDNSELKIVINYILSKGYNIVYLNELLDEKNECK